VTETKPNAPGEVPAKPKVGEEPTMHVRALKRCYVDGVYYYPGDEFDVVASGFHDEAMEKAPAPKKP
jgi:hypothetical protein